MPIMSEGAASSFALGQQEKARRRAEAVANAEAAYTDLAAEAAKEAAEAEAARQALVAAEAAEAKERLEAEEAEKASQAADALAAQERLLLLLPMAYLPCMYLDGPCTPSVLAHVPTMCVHPAPTATRSHGAGTAGG